MIRSACVVSLLALLPAAGALRAQSVYGEISGAAVTLTNNGADEARKVQSDPAGNYAAVNLEAGTYEVAIENSGVRKAVTKDVVLSAREIARVGARLEIAAAVRCSRRGT